MSRFHASVRDLFEDIYIFLADGLQNEVLSSSSLTQREKLLTQLISFQKEYPELHLGFKLRNDGTKSDLPHRSSSSPVSYVDMNGGSPYKSPSNQMNDNTEEKSDKSETKKLQHSASSLENTSNDYSTTKEVGNQSLAESEDYLSDDAKNLPYVAASELAICDKAGYLDKKKRDSIKGWLNPYQRRWCAIKDGVLYYYEKFTDRKQKGSIVLAGYEARPLLDDNNETKKYSNNFELVCPGKRTYQFSSASEKDMQQWIAAIEKNNKSTYSGNQSSSNMPTSSYPAPKESDCHDEGDDIYETVLEEEEKAESADDKVEEPSFENEEYSDVEAISEQNQVFNYSDWYVGLWDCSSDDATELSFARGDLIQIVSKEYDSFAWWIGELQGKVGFVPKSYLMEAYETY